MMEEAVLRWLREHLPFVEPASETDSETVKRQIGRAPRGEYAVARRCPRDLPAVVLTLPFAGGGTSVPPLLWLCCPSASARTGTLESSCAAGRVREWLASDIQALADFQLDEEAYGELQRGLARMTGGERLADRLEGRGAAGGKAGAVKCLHAHLAYRLATAGPGPPAGEDSGSPAGCDNETRSRPGAIGAWCEQELEKEGGAWCERPPAACVP